MVKIRLSKLLSILAGFLRLASYVCVYMMSYVIAISEENDYSAVLWFQIAILLGCAASATVQAAFDEKKDGN